MTARSPSNGVSPQRVRRSPNCEAGGNTRRNCALAASALSAAAVGAARSSSDGASRAPSRAHGGAYIVACARSSGSLETGVLMTHPPAAEAVCLQAVDFAPWRISRRATGTPFVCACPFSHLPTPAFAGHAASVALARLGPAQEFLE